MPWFVSWAGQNDAQRHPKTLKGHRTSFKGFFCLVLLFPFTRITVLLSSTAVLSHYPSAVHRGREHCLFLTVPQTHRASPAQGNTSRKVQVDFFFYPLQVLAVEQIPLSFLQWPSPEKGPCTGLGQQHWIHSAQGSWVHKYFKINPPCQGCVSRHSVRCDFRHSEGTWQKLALASDSTQTGRGQNQHCEKSTKPRIWDVVKSHQSTISSLWEHQQG